MKYLARTAFLMAMSGWTGCGGGAAQQPSAAPLPHGGGSPHDVGASKPTEGGATGAVPDESAGSDEQAAYEKARPVFATYCASCHTSKGATAKPAILEHFSMDGYPFGGHHATEITARIRSVLGATGAKPTMPPDRPGAVKGEELQLILAWADAVDRAKAGDAAGKSDDHEHGGTQKPGGHQH